MADVGNWSSRLRDDDGKEIPRPSPPDELVLAWNCERWNSLPYGGGLLDQPAGLMDKLSLLSKVHNAYKVFRNKKPGEEDKIPQEVFDTIKMIDEMRKEDGTK